MENWHNMWTAFLLTLVALSTTCEGADSIRAPRAAIDNCTLTGRVCLRGPHGPHEGNVFIGVGNGISKPVCDDDWDINDGRVVCRELGYHWVRKVTSGSRYGWVSSDFGADNVNCDGTESGLAECSYSSKDDCGGSQGAGVVCDGRISKIAPCFVDGVSFQCGEYIDFDVVESALECQQHCRNHVDCNYFTFYPSTRQCYRKRVSTLTETASYGAVSGPRNCGEPPSLHPDIPDVPFDPAAVTDLDRTFSFFGFHFGIKYKDPSDRAKGGELSLARSARSQRFNVHVKFDGGVSKTDGLFDLDIDYYLLHHGLEVGTLKMFRHKEGNNWVSHLKTQTSQAPFRTIIPSMINNAQIDVVSDRQTKFYLKYVDRFKYDHNLEINVDRISGREARVSIGRTDDSRYMIDLKFIASDLNLRQFDGNFIFGMEGTVGREVISGSVVSTAESLGYRIKVDLTVRARKELQIDAKVKADRANRQYSTKLQYSVRGGNFQGIVNMKFANNEFSFSLVNSDAKEKLEYRVFLNPGDKLEIEGKWNGESMWKYSAKMTTVDNAQKYQLTLTTDMTLDSRSIFYNLLPYYGLLTPFNKRTGEFKFYLNKNARNVLLNKFYVKGEIKKDNQIVMKALVDTIQSPYKISLDMPAVLQKIRRNMDKYEVTVLHIPDHKLEIFTNDRRFFRSFRIIKSVAGNTREIEMNDHKLGRLNYNLTEDSLTTQITGTEWSTGNQLMRIDIATKKTVHDNGTELVLRDSVEIVPDSVGWRAFFQKLKRIIPRNPYRRIARFYNMFFTPFNRTGVTEIFLTNERTRVDLSNFRSSLLKFYSLPDITTLFSFPVSFLFNKFHLKSEVKTDNQTVMKTSLNTIESPYKISLYMPALLNVIFRNMDTYEATFDPSAGQLREIVSNGRRLKGFNMFKTGRGNEREVEFNGRLIKHDYNVTEDFIKSQGWITTVTKLETREISDLEIFFNKKEKYKFYVKGGVKIGAQIVMNALLTTNESPYRISLDMPYLLNKISRNLDKYEVTVHHNPNHKLEVFTIANDRKEKRLKIVRTGNGDERELEILGEKFLLTDNSLETKIRLPDGNWIEPKITWRGRLPNNAREAEAFFLENNLRVQVRGSRRCGYDPGLWNMDWKMDWKMDRPDFVTPWNCKIDFNISGEGPCTYRDQDWGTYRDQDWGTYSISRNVKATVAFQEIKLAVSGEASFTRGPFAEDSPIVTDVDLTYRMNNGDLFGKFSKVIKGIEYPIPLYNDNYLFKNLKIMAILMNVFNFYP